jgi:hypothetical protein
MRVSDHAVLRAVERIYGFNVDKVRADIAEAVARAPEGASAIIKDRVKYVIKDNTVVTVRPEGYCVPKHLRPYAEREDYELSGNTA